MASCHTRATRGGGTLVRELPNLGSRGQGQQGATFPSLIAATNGDGPLVLIEGHTRATAYAITNSPADVIIGTSPDMTNWKYWSPPTTRLR
jgi:hypothetical protein